mmetsp:Transcript_15592/g.21868  ORF Transcript_15592/g.21868 Transcript_15592/m.21868 type:complete len:257 (-) Transcript_15592:158-928(-)
MACKMASSVTSVPEPLSCCHRRFASYPRNTCSYNSKSCFGNLANGTLSPTCFSVMRVLTKPGLTTLTEIFHFHNSIRNDADTPSTACFVAVYTAFVGLGAKAARLEMLMMRPSVPRSIGMHARVNRNTPKTFTSKQRLTLVISSISTGSPDEIPALLTSATSCIFRSSSSLLTDFIVVSTLSHDATSRITGTREGRSFTRLSLSACFLTPANTVKPAASRASAADLPMPELQPDIRIAPFLCTFRRSSVSHLRTQP